MFGNKNWQYQSLKENFFKVKGRMLENGKGRTSGSEVKFAVYSLHFKPKDTKVSQHFVVNVWRDVSFYIPHQFFFHAWWEIELLLYYKKVVLD